jgi:hypothetical protein
VTRCTNLFSTSDTYIFVLLNEADRDAQGIYQPSQSSSQPSFTLAAFFATGALSGVLGLPLLGVMLRAPGPFNAGDALRDPEGDEVLLCCNELMVWLKKSSLL